ncbi:DUF2568 domain-containing protein [Paenarthrobacter sp. DKR-5]|uniref:YrdB family protein n=1 Tax=Paenarthrobacter sp. DKR-5 TaxID=2835535 RepID=UPI001BDBFF8A|nr:YrdB family protein [Paenarthrobacter sp. DKR-5]MBT1003071.1 DUF2568 domain-containing protein [Paenarthrobacter sp. DKR-5]
MSRRRAPSAPLAVTGVQQAVAFLLEVALLVAVAVFGFHAPAPWNFVAGIGLPAVVVLFWSVFMAPKSSRRLPWPLQPLVALGLFLLGALALAAAGQPAAGVVFAVVAAGNTVLSFYLERRS